MKHLQPLQHGSHHTESAEQIGVPSLKSLVVLAADVVNAARHAEGPIARGNELSGEAGPRHFTFEERKAAVEHVLSQLCSGRTVRSILLADRANPELPRLPNVSTWWRWVSEDPGLAEHLARAREFGIEALLDECIDIADRTEEEPGSRRVRVETRIKLAQMMKPRSYSPRLDLATDQPTMGLAERLAAARKRALEGR